MLSPAPHIMLCFRNFLVEKNYTFGYWYNQCDKSLSPFSSKSSPPWSDVVLCTTWCGRLCCRLKWCAGLWPLQLTNGYCFRFVFVG
ncbi:unnamed protein product [Lathyrus sativus]|nr:unnamed protein product [Lathyrus sativus]